MRFTLFALLTLAASAIAVPLVERQDGGGSSPLDSLIGKVNKDDGALSRSRLSCQSAMAFPADLVIF